MSDTTDLTPVLTASKVIEEHGGPGWYEWCSLDLQEIHVQSDESYESMVKVWGKCQQACECAVIAYAGEVKAWNAQDEMFAIELGNAQLGWVWSVSNYAEDIVRRGYEPTQLTASLALICAVADQLKEQG